MFRGKRASGKILINQELRGLIDVVPNESESVGSVLRSRIGEVVDRAGPWPCIVDGDFRVLSESGCEVPQVNRANCGFVVVRGIRSSLPESEERYRTRSATAESRRKRGGDFGDEADVCKVALFCMQKGSIVSVPVKGHVAKRWIEADVRPRRKKARGQDTRVEIFGGRTLTIWKRDHRIRR